MTQAGAAFSSVRRRTVPALHPPRIGAAEPPRNADAPRRRSSHPRPVQTGLATLLICNVAIPCPRRPECATPPARWREVGHRTRNITDLKCCDPLSASPRVRNAAGPLARSGAGEHLRQAGAAFSSVRRRTVPGLHPPWILAAGPPTLHSCGDRATPVRRDSDAPAGLGCIPSLQVDGRIAGDRRGHSARCTHKLRGDS